MASAQSSNPNNPDTASKNHQRSKTSVIRSFIHRRANSEGGVFPPPFNLPSEIFQPMGGALDAHEMLLSKPLVEIQQNQVDHSRRSPCKSREDSCLDSNVGGVSTGFALKKSNNKDTSRNGSPAKTKSSTNQAGLLGKPKSLKRLKKTVEQEEKNKENRTPVNEGLQSTSSPPIYTQFATAGLGSQDDYVSFPQLPGSSKSDPRNGIPKSCQGPHASKEKFDLPRPGFAAKGSAKASMDVGGRKETPLEEPIGGSQRPHRSSRPISIAHPPPRIQSKQDLRKQRPNEPFIDSGEIDTHLEAMLDRRNIPENQRYKMRNLSDTVKIEFIRQDWAEAAGAAKDTSNRQASSVLRSADIVSVGAGHDGATRESKEGKKMSRARAALTLTKPRRGGKDSAPASPTKRTAIGTLGRHFRSKSSESIAGAVNRPESAGSTGSARTGNSSGAAGLLAQVTGRRENTAVEHVSYLRKTPKPEIVEVGKLHKLRLLLRNETVAWTEDFIRQGGMKEIVGLLHRIMEVEWREEHEDALLHETLLCLKALCTVALGLQYLHKAHDILFPALLKMLFDPEKKGPAEFTTRGIITSVMFRYIETGSTPGDRMSRAKDVLSYLRDPKPVEAEQPVGFVLEMRKDRPYRVWCKEVVSVTKEVFWIFLHNLNVVPLPGEGNCKSKSAMSPAAGPATSLTDDPPPVTSASSVYFPSPEQEAQAQYMAAYFPKERPPVAAAPYMGGVEWDATNYLASHLDLLNAIIACAPTFSARNSLRSQLRISGFEKCLGGSLRLCKEKFYGAVHDGLRTWVAAAHADAWDVRDVRYGPPPPLENVRSRSQSPFKKAKREAEPPRIEMPQLNLELEQPRSAGQLLMGGQSGAEGRNDTRDS